MKAARWCFETWTSSYEGKSPAELMNKMHEEGIVFRASSRWANFKTSHGCVQQYENKKP